MTTDTPTLLQPDPATIVVSYHPRHGEGDCVSVQFDDRKLGRFVIALTPETVEYLAILFTTAVKSPRISCIADQMRAEQRDTKR